nr:MAG TPA: Herpes virus major outer envelope glycoprotein (BLLF1) [Caudoviricetes sp.]
MKRIIASIGLGAAVVGGMISPAIAEDTPQIHAEITKATSASRQVSSEVNISGTWTVERLAVGQSFTVSTTPQNGAAPFKWAASFPFVLDDGSKIGECTANEATLTCKVDTVPPAYADKENVKGSWWARARLQDGVVGTEEGTITLNGEVVKTLVWGDSEGTGVCTNDCDSAGHYEYAKPENLKFGWTNDNGTVGWAIKWIATPGAEYVVKDFDTKLGTTVKCTKTGEWNPATTEIITANRIDENTIKFVAPADSKVCITFPPEQMKVPEGQSSVTNRAEVNGLKLEATTTIRSNGGTDGDGSNKPKPTPTPSVTTPTPEPTPSETPKPTPTPSTPAPKPSETPTPVPTTPTPKPSVTTPAPKPSATTPAPKQPVAKESPKTSEQPKLAKTGSSAAFAGVLAMLLALIGVGFYTISRKDNN